MTAKNHLPAPGSDWAFFLDVDGTLIDIAATPDDIAIDPSVPPTLARLSEAADGALALISGRPLSDLDRLFAPLDLPLAGLHGIERRNGEGKVFRPSKPEDGIKEILDGMHEFARLTPGILVEDKGFTAAIHFRGAPKEEIAVLRLAEGLLSAAGGDLELQNGKMVVEIKPAGADKGSAIEAFMRERPFAGRNPVFIGDDVTDEDGFATVNRLGGHSIRIGCEAATAAQWCVGTVDEFLAWLFAAPAAMGAQAPA
jgi:trehalose 6-phosphate phosphatase